MTDVTVISQADALRNSSLSVGLADATGLPTTALVAQLLRRAVFNAAPCSVGVARSLVVTALAPLIEDVAVLEAQVEDVLESLVAIGDLLEMRREVADASEVVLRPAPPAFIIRRDSTFIILGVAGDEITPLQDKAVYYHPSGLRTLAPTDTKACREALLDIGLIQLSERNWLHTPAATTVRDFVDSWSARLPAEKHPEKIENLQILDTKASTSFYKGRWKSLSDCHSGLFIARRPQRYGANLWCLADVHGGLIQRFVDIHPKDLRFRDCDEAWRLQAAMDAMAGSPQRVSILQNEGSARLCFSSPLPLWATRRLSLMGEQVAQQNALLAFQFAQQNIEEELRWLEESLWLARQQGSAA